MERQIFCIIFGGKDVFLSKQGAAIVNTPPRSRHVYGIREHADGPLVHCVASIFTAPKLERGPLLANGGSDPNRDGFPLRMGLVSPGNITIQEVTKGWGKRL